MNRQVSMLTLLLMGVLAGGLPFAEARSSQNPPGRATMSVTESTVQTATLAGGCFWCVEADFEKVPGVIKAISGYTGGQGADPTYDDYGRKGHVEAVQVIYDPQKVSYQELLEYFWRHIDPTDAYGQFVDRGAQYRSAIFYHDDEQRRLAEKSKQELEKSGRFTKPIVTEILPFTGFYRAEDYHQDYYKNHSLRYRYYRSNSGRDQFLRKVWGEEPKPGSAKGGNPP